MNGKEIKINNKRSLNSNNISLYFDRDEIKKSFEEVNIIASNQHYYGDFYFDDVFMNSLNKKVSLLDADALIFEKDLSRYSFYNENYIYFTAIKFK